MSTPSKVDELLDAAGLALVDGFGDVTEVKRVVQSMRCSLSYLDDVLDHLAEKLDGDGTLAKTHTTIREDPSIRRARKPLMHQRRAVA